MKVFHGILALVLLFAGACQALPFQKPPVETLPAGRETVGPTSTIERSATPEAGTASPAPVTLRIWLPQEFDPASGSSAGTLLQARLDEFQQIRPRVRLDVRLKSMEDPGSLLEALSTTSAAAPLALPDLIALPRPVMEAAALKGLLFPLEGLTSIMDRPDWYEYGRQMARLQNSTFGIPFAGDTMLMVYQDGLLEEDPLTWESALNMAAPVAFPAADHQALYTLSLYRAAGGIILDEHGRPTLEADILARVLATFHEAESAGVLPIWLTQLETDDQAWEAYLGGSAPAVLTWASRYLSGTGEGQQAAAVPTLDGIPYSLATGWVWSLAGPSPEKQALAIELAEFLTEPAFMAEWTAAAGYLPPRAEAMQMWTDQFRRALGGQVSQSAQVIPPGDVMSALAPVLRQAAIQILKQQGEPPALAEEAFLRLQNPY